jgi:hypothetical protein
VCANWGKKYDVWENKNDPRWYEHLFGLLGGQIERGELAVAIQQASAAWGMRAA